jgi:predicted transposase/invertase (TIGR01784 family)
MVKFRRLSGKDIGREALQRWLTWLDKESPREAVEEVIRMDSGIRKAEEKMEYVTRDKEALRAYQMREMALSDWTSGLNHARKEGIQEGMQEGIQKGRLEIARNLKKIGVPVGQIAQGTGLSVEDIAKL